MLNAKDGKKPRTERYAQYLFLAVASTYCDTNNLNVDVSPEPNAGNGPVDFKLSQGADSKCLVELKMSSSSRLEHCLDEQIPAYMKAEKASHAVYLLVQTGNDERVNKFIQRYNGLPVRVRSSIELIVVDAKPKASASKR